MLYLFYHASHPRGFSSAVVIQNANETFSLAMVAMAQTLPVLLGGLDLSVGAVMTLVNCLASTRSPAALARSRSALSSASRTGALAAS